MLKRQQILLLNQAKYDTFYLFSCYVINLHYFRICRKKISKKIAEHVNLTTLPPIVSYLYCLFFFNSSPAGPFP